MGSGINSGQRKAELAIEHLPTVDKEIQQPPTELDIGYIRDRIAENNPSILIESELAVNSIEDEVFEHPDLLKLGDTITLTSGQLRGVLSRAALSGVAITATKIGTALRKKEQINHLLEFEPLEPAEV